MELGLFRPLADDFEDGTLDLIHDFFAPPGGVCVEAGAESVTTG